MDIRRAIAVMLMDAGYAHYEIARELHRSRTAIAYLTRTHHVLYEIDAPYTTIFNTIKALQ